eukprot:5923710-Pyramimonas_sp.AAC.1
MTVAPFPVNGRYPKGRAGREGNGNSGRGVRPPGCVHATGASIACVHDNAQCLRATQRHSRTHHSASIHHNNR